MTLTVRQRALLALVGGLVLLVAGCGDADDDAADGGDASTDTDVLPFEQVQASDFVFEVDPSDPSRGIFRVATTEPMICAIVWGETEALGNLNNSLAMSGTGIIEHDVVLPGATGGGTYHFRVQGSTADGRLFQSPVATFTLPEAEAAAAPATEVERGPNLALSATVVERSSEFSPDWTGANAGDDDLSTEWATADDGDDGYIVFDLGAPQDIAGVEFVTRSMADGSAVTDRYTVTVDGGDPVGPFATGTVAEPGFVDLDATGQIVRFDIESSTGGNTGAVEIRILAPAGG